MNISPAHSSRCARHGRPVVIVLALVAVLGATPAPGAEPEPAKTPHVIDFNREIRPILSNACFFCHGPDANKRKGASKPFRLDTEEGLFADLGGYASVVKGNPDESELIARVTSEEKGEVMPPAETGKKLSPKEIELLKEWVRQGAPYAKHWSYVKPARAPLPENAKKDWARNEVDRFILDRLEREKLEPSPEADRATLIRRLSLDLTGLPPRLEDVDAFLRDTSPDAYEKVVNRLLDSPAYGEHWARMWLDLARYADSAGYADDPPRTIWAYRDYVIRSLNQNKPFDAFTVEQIAGDLLPNPTQDQIIATAFHRNTLTNNEGGTNDEEFRNVAVVDRVNTTMSVWMGTTMACAQCHDHKYDPLTQAEYFKLFAFFNNSEDADRGDESPLLTLFTDEQLRQRDSLSKEIAALEADLKTSTPTRVAGQKAWEEGFARGLDWNVLKPSQVASKSGSKLKTLDDGSVLVATGSKTDVTTTEQTLAAGKLTALRLEALADDSLPGKGPGFGGGNFVVSKVTATIKPPGSKSPTGRFVRVELPGKEQYLSLAEVQVFKGTENLALKGEARQINVSYAGVASRAIDGNTDGEYFGANSTTHTEASENPWWEVDLKGSQPIERIAVWNRTDGGAGGRLRNFRVTILDENRNAVWSGVVAEPPGPSASLTPDRSLVIRFSTALADYSQGDFEASSVIDNKDPGNKGWAVAGQLGQPHALTLLTASPVEVEEGSTLSVAIEQGSKFENHTLGRFRLSTTGDARVPEYAGVPGELLALLKIPADARSEAQRNQIAAYYLRAVSPELKSQRERLAVASQQFAGMKPATSVPIVKELTSSARRVTKIQLRGNFLDQGDEVNAGTPATFPGLPKGASADRLALARWLVSEENPLTARVIANRYWESIFGNGLVPTSEEFGSQGELPTHPELLDWLATELVREHWDLKAFLKLLVTSATYRQSSKATSERLKRDPDNTLLARGPRIRLSAEMIRDQALAIAGLLSPKAFGPPVKPPQPSTGLAAAFGSGIDWQTSTGEDRFRRGLYTTWRRSNPYPSMTTFDAPNREVCTVKRSRTNTPLQALVTLNDPVYVEAAQALARRMFKDASTTADRAKLGFKLCLARDPSDAELDRLVKLYETANQALAEDATKANELATNPIGPVPAGASAAELGAWTVVCNVLLNLDETLMKP